jgi:hypothetical protein
MLFSFEVSGVMSAKGAPDCVRVSGFRFILKLPESELMSNNLSQSGQTPRRRKAQGNADRAEAQREERDDYVLGIAALIVSMGKKSDKGSS